MVGDAAEPGVEVVQRLERIPFCGFHRRLILFLGAGNFFDGFDSLAIGSALAAIFVTLHISFTNAGLLGGIANLGQFVGGLAAGFTAEAVGRKKTYLYSIGLFGLLSLLIAVSWNFASLLLFRLIQGLGLGGAEPSAAALFNEYVQGQRRGRYVVLYQWLFVWALLITPLVALALISAAGPALGWRLLYGVGFLPFIWAIVGAYFLPESARWLASHGRSREALAILDEAERSAQAGGLPLPDVRLDVHPENRATRFAELFEGVYARRTTLTFILWFANFFIAQGAQVWLPSLYVRLGHLTPSTALLLTALENAMALVAGYIGASVIDSVGRVRLFTTAFAVVLLGIVVGLVGIAVSHYALWLILFISSAVIFLGYITSSIALFTYTPELYPTRMRGLATGLALAVSRLGSFIATFLIGVVLAAGGGAPAVYGMLGVLALAALLTLLALGVETKGRVLEEISP